MAPVKFLGRLLVGVFESEPSSRQKARRLERERQAEKAPEKRVRRSEQRRTLEKGARREYHTTQPKRR